MLKYLVAMTMGISRIFRTGHENLFGRQALLKGFIVEAKLTSIEVSLDISCNQYTWFILIWYITIVYMYPCTYTYTHMCIENNIILVQVFLSLGTNDIWD